MTTDNCLTLDWIEVAAQNGWRKLKFDDGVVYAVIEYIPSHEWCWEVQIRGEGGSGRASSTLFRVSSSQYPPLSGCGNDEELDYVKREVAREIAFLNYCFLSFKNIKVGDLIRSPRNIDGSK